MFRNVLLALATMVAAMGLAFAQVDVNKADAAALDSVKGIGPVKSRAIIEERTKHGDFKDWADFEKRVKGVGDKAAVKLSKAGLQVNGMSKEGASASAVAAASEPKAPAKPKKGQPKTDMKAPEAPAKK